MGKALTRCIANAGRPTVARVDNVGEGFAGRVETLCKFSRNAVQKTNLKNLDLSKLWSDLTLRLCDQGCN